VSWGANRIDVFARGGNGGVWGRVWDARGWHGWSALGGFVTTAPDVASRAFNRLDIFARGADGAVYQREWTGTGFTGWHPVP
jgi:hypothetical protein